MMLGFTTRTTQTQMPLRISMVPSQIPSLVHPMICRFHQRTFIPQRRRCGHLYKPGRRNTNMPFGLVDLNPLGVTGRKYFTNVTVAENCQLKTVREMTHDVRTTESALLAVRRLAAC